MTDIVMSRAIVERALEAFETDDWQKKLQSAINLRSALAQECSPVMWQYRWFDTHPNTVTSGQWSEWIEVKPRNIHIETVLDHVNEIQTYIDRGYKYELRALYVK